MSYKFVDSKANKKVNNTRKLYPKQNNSINSKSQ